MWRARTKERTHVQDWLITIPPVAVYLVTGVVVGVESLGIPVPGETVLVAAALMSSRSGLSISPHDVALAGVLGAATGDSIGYAIGRRYGDRLFVRLARRFPRHVNDDVLGYSAHVFGRWGVFAVFFGRFVALLRIFAGPLSGALRLSYPKFLIANVAGALCWAGGTTYLVYYLGTAAESSLKSFSYVGLGVALVLAVLASTLLRRHLNRRVEAFAAAREVAPAPSHEEVAD